MGYRSRKVIQTGTFRKLGCGFSFAFYSNYGRILAVCEIVSVKEWRDLRYWCEVSRVRAMLLMSVAYNFFCLLLGLLFCCLSIYR